MIPLTNADFYDEADTPEPPWSEPVTIKGRKGPLIPPPPWDEADSIVLDAPQRIPRGPVGPDFGDRKPLCKPCGHTWSEHDDYGCLWNLCGCGEPGERK